MPTLLAAGRHDGNPPVPRRWVLAAAALLSVLSVSAFVGWSVGSSILVRPFGGFPPVYPHFALGLGLSGLSLWALARWHGSLAVVSGAALLVLGLTASFGLVWTRWPIGPSPAPLGESGPSLARGLIFMLTSLAIVLTVLARRWTPLWNIVGLSGVTLLALSLMLLSARLLGLVRELDSPMTLLLGASPQIIVGGFVIGIVFTRAAWRDLGFAQVPPAWVPWAIGFGAVVALVLLWRALLLNEANDLKHVVQAAASSAAARLAAPIEASLLKVDRLARRTVDPARPVWPTDSAPKPPIPAGLIALATAPAVGRILAVDPPDGLFDPITRSAAEAGLARLRSPTWPDRTPRHFRLDRDRFGIAIPIYVGDQAAGFAIGLIDLQQLLPSDIADSARFGYRLWFGDVAVAGETVTADPWLEQADIFTSTPTGRLEVWPRPRTVHSLRSNLPNVVFAFGLAVAILLPISVQLARTAWDRARVIERGQLYAALERGADGVWEIDPTHGTIRPSPNLWRHLGYPARTLPFRQETWIELIHPDDRARYRAAHNASLAEGGEAFELQYRIRAQDGTWHQLVERGRVTERDQAGAPGRMLGIIGDVTERHQVEEARQASEQRYRATFESAFQFQALLAPDGTCLDVNRTALSYGGVTLEGVRAQPFWETPWWRSDRETQARIASVCRAAATGTIQRLEVEAEGLEGSRVVLDLSIKPLLASDGTVEQLLVEGRDLTERKRAEKLLREVEILATMGRVAAKVAHEINNPLAGIQNSFLLIKDAIPPSHPHIRYVGAIEREIGRISAVTRQLYETFRPERNGASEPLDVVIAETVALIRQLNRTADVNIVTDLRKALPEGVVPAAIVRQTVYNLVQNAVDASPPGGEIRVVTQTVPGGYELRVKDQGPGVPGVVQDRIFDPFYTTKPNSLRPGGMGLGLYLVRRSVEALGGVVRLVSPPEGGTEFVIWFPSYRPSIAGV